MMQELPKDHKMNELLALAKDGYEKAKSMYETATEIAENLEKRAEDKQAEKEQTGVSHGN